MLSINDPIPEMELEAYVPDKFEKIKLSDYLGQWLVILFYPADFTFVCPTELEDAASHEKEFAEEGAAIVSVSADTAFVHKAWHDHSESIRQINYPMIADPTGKLCEAFGTYLPGEGLSLRATFIVDPDGLVKSLELHDNSIGRNITEILRKLRAAKFVREHPGLACPANWQPGNKSLKPGVELVGKI